MKILILGKPRAGKTTMATSLSEKLDLVRISPEIWLEDLFKRIKEREENEDPEEEAPEGGEEEKQPEEEGGEGSGEENGEEAEIEYQKDENGEFVLDEEGNKIPVPKPEVIEEPKEPEEPKRAKKDEWLTDLEYEVRNTMRDGKALDLD